MQVQVTHTTSKVADGSQTRSPTKKATATATASVSSFAPATSAAAPTCLLNNWNWAPLHHSDSTLSLSTLPLRTFYPYFDLEFDTLRRTQLQ